MADNYDREFSEKLDDYLGDFFKSFRYSNGEFYNSNSGSSGEEDTDVKVPSMSELMPLAKSFKNLYDSFIEVGFDSDTAIAIIINFLKAVISN